MLQGAGGSADANQFGANRDRREYEIHESVGDGTVRHAGLPGAIVLRERDAAGPFDGPNAECPVCGGSRQDDTDGLMSASLGERTKEQIDRVMQRANRSWLQFQRRVFDRQILPRREHVNRVGRNRLAIDDFDDWHRGRARQDVRKSTRVSRIEMRHGHERHAGVVRQRRDQGCEGFQSTRGRANAYDREHSVDFFRHGLLDAVRFSDARAR